MIDSKLAWYQRECNDLEVILIWQMAMGSRKRTE